MESLLKGSKYKYLEIVSSRGCTHRCRFCYRHVRGVRRHSVGYIIKYIKLLREHCDVDGVYFVDDRSYIQSRGNAVSFLDPGCSA